MVSELPTDLVRALEAAAATDRLLVASDFDGTLAPIVSNPADARPLRRAAQALTAIADLPATSVVLISGRALRVLRELSGAPPSVHLVGSHGAEFDTGFAHAVDESLLARITAELNAIAADRPGVTVVQHRRRTELVEPANHLGRLHERVVGAEGLRRVTGRAADA